MGAPRRNGCLPLPAADTHCRADGRTLGRPSAPTQRVAYLTNTGGRRVRADSAVLDDLAHAVARPVQWYDAMRLMRELGATCAVQMPPGHALAALVARSTPSMYALALADDGIERAVAAGAAL